MKHIKLIYADKEFIYLDKEKERQGLTWEVFFLKAVSALKQRSKEQ